MGSGTTKIAHEGGKDRPLMDYFKAAFPWTYFTTIVSLTNVALAVASLDPTSIGDLLKFIGIMSVISQVEFLSRYDCWSTSEYEISCHLPHNFGKRFGMSRT